MNEELQKQLILFIESTKSMATGGATFLSAEIPDVIHQLLLWKAISSGAVFLISTALTLITLYAAYFVIMKLPKRVAEKFDQEGYQYLATRILEREYSMSSVAVVVLAPFAFVCFIVAMCNLAWLKIWIAPKLYLLEYVASLIK